MKNIAYIILWGLILVFPSCKSADSVYEEYLVHGGLLYPAKAMHPAVYPGDERVEISWLNGTDPMVVKARISWNNYTDWEDVDINPGMDVIRKEIKPLEETTYSFMIRTYDGIGNISVPVEVFGKVYGKKYKSSLVTRTLKNSEFDQFEDVVQLEWYESEATEIGMELEYTDINDQVRKITLANTETTATITNVKTDAPIYYTSVFRPDSMAIDVFQGPRVQVRSTLPDLPYSVNVTTQFLKNTDAPFAKGAHIRGDRWFSVVDWTTNAAAATNGNVDTHEELLGGVLGFIVWDALLPAQSITNGKLYQTVNLAAGKYRFDAYLFGNTQTSGNPKAYVVAALGDDLPDTDDTEQMALGFVSVPGPLGAGANLQLSVEFFLSERSVVSLGFVATSGNRCQVYFRKVELWRLFE